MSQTGHRDLEGGGDPGRCYLATVTCRFGPDLTDFAIIDSHNDQSRSTPNDPNQSSPEELEPQFRDSAWPLYSVYSNIAQDEINKMVECCQRDTDGILIFVSSHVRPQMTPHTIREM